MGLLSFVLDYNCALTVRTLEYVVSVKESANSHKRTLDGSLILQFFSVQLYRLLHWEGHMILRRIADGIKNMTDLLALVAYLVNVLLFLKHQRGDLFNYHFSNNLQFDLVVSYILGTLIRIQTKGGMGNGTIKGNL